MDIREAHIGDAPAIARVHVDSWCSTYSGIVPAEYLAQLDYGQREQNCYDRIKGKGDGQFIYLAEEVGEVVGFASAGPENSGNSTYDGELYVMYILEAHQRKGIGRHLISHLAESLRQAGIESMLVWVLADNPFRKFYERLGGQPVAEQCVSIGGAELKEVAYGWRDIQVLTVTDN
ncbi:MAG TPA: GNAT family N-acetyltransferase [Dehalococcoidia bacterium]|nr:GNAT family N-acetyltransferase [Dehalococcoidia bacterium]